MKDIVVIGGGISGLATAYGLRALGLDVVVLEHHSKPGGNAISEFVGGFLMEHGPSSVAANMPAVDELCRNLDLESKRCELSSAIKRLYLVKHNRLVGIPLGPGGFFLSNYLSPQGRLRMLVEFAIPRRTDTAEESLADFTRRRFGVEFTDRLMDPFAGGVFAGIPEAISIASLLPKLALFEQDMGSVTLGILNALRKGQRMPGSRMFSWRNGIGALPMTLAHELGGAVKTGSKAGRIDQRNGCFHIDCGDHGTVTTRSIVLATQPHVSTELLKHVNPDLAESIGEITAPPLAVVFLGYRRCDIEHPLDGQGYLCASREGRTVNGVQFTSTMYPGRAPEDHVSFSLYFGGGRNPEIGLQTERELISLAHQEMKDLLGASAEPVLTKVRHWPHGIPQYHVGHVGLMNRVKTSLCNTPGLFLVGNYFKGPSVAACVSLASDTVGDISRYLSEQGIFSPS